MSDPIEAAIFETLAKADPKGVGGKSVEPADVAKHIQTEQWQRVLPKVRATALGLMRQGRLTITKKGKVVDPSNFRGVTRLRLPTDAETAAALAALPPAVAEDDDDFAYRPAAPDLEAVLTDIRACRACLGDLPHEPRPVVRVFPETRLLICGQAPGRRVHESGMPFTDPSGDRLRDWMGVDYETFYADRRIGVAAQAFCYPGTAPKGGDYPPPTRCATLWRPRLLEALPRMELTLLVGGYSQVWALGERARANMTETVRAWRDYAPTILPLPHPSWRNTAWLRRNPWFEDEVVPHLRQRVRDILVP